MSVCGNDIVRLLKKEVCRMKKYIIPIFLAFLLLLSACSPQLKESDFILTNEDLSDDAYMKYRALFHSYFSSDDYGGKYMENVSVIVPAE